MGSVTRSDYPGDAAQHLADVSGQLGDDEGLLHAGVPVTVAGHRVLGVAR